MLCLLQYPFVVALTLVLFGIIEAPPLRSAGVSPRLLPPCLFSDSQRGTSLLRVVAPANYELQQTNGPISNFVAGESGTTLGERDGLFPYSLPTYLCFCRSPDEASVLALLSLYPKQAFSHPGMPFGRPQFSVPTLLQ